MAAITASTTTTTKWAQQGKAIPLSEEQKLDLMNVTVVKQYASKCYRTLLVAYCDYTDAQWQSLKKEHRNFEKE
jgi:hypothetical protein